MVQSQLQRPLIEFQAPPLHRQPNGTVRIPKRGAVVSQAKTDIQNPQCAGGRPDVQFRRSNEFGLGFIQGTR